MNTIEGSPIRRGPIRRVTSFLVGMNFSRKVTSDLYLVEGDDQVVFGGFQATVRKGRIEVMQTTIGERKDDVAEKLAVEAGVTVKFDIVKVLKPGDMIQVVAVPLAGEPSFSIALKLARSTPIPT